MAYKKCSKCNQKKQLIDFHKDDRYAMGVKGWCKLCTNEYKRIRRSNNPDLAQKESEASLAFYRKAINSDKACELKKRKSEYDRKYRIKWESQNREKANEKTARRRAKKLQATPSWLTNKHRRQMRLIYLEAQVLSQRGFKYHVDHIVPLKGKNCSGLHVPWNLRAIPAKINESKSNNVLDKMPKISMFA